MKKTCLLAILMTGLSACSTVAEKLDTGPSPDLPKDWRLDPSASHIDAPPLSAALRPSTAAYTQNAAATSLWSSSPKSLFGDRRASQMGDILTVVIELDEEAEMNNSVSQSRDADQDFSVNALFGLPEILSRSLPDGASLTPAIDISRGSDLNGQGTISRQEKLTLRLAAQVTEITPNGYLGVMGQQEIMVNNEMRYLQVTGLIRTQDITRLNTITYDKIANARIFYGGRGAISRSVKEGKGNRLINSIVPF